MHSIPLYVNEKGQHIRFFFTTKDHVLHRTKPLPLAIHPHRFDLKFTMLKGTLMNETFEVANKGELSTILTDKYRFKSEILTGDGMFEKVEEGVGLRLLGATAYTLGDSFSMRSDELHTVSVPRGTIAAWLIEESDATGPYEPISYSDNDLNVWNKDLLYKDILDIDVIAILGPEILSRIEEVLFGTDTCTTLRELRDKLSNESN